MSLSGIHVLTALKFNGFPLRSSAGMTKIESLTIMSKLIEIQGLYYSADNGSMVFEDVYAEFYGGERVAIIGPLGSGKTTLLRLFLGLYKPQRGKVYLFGSDTGVLEPSGLNGLRQRIGVIFEDAAVISNLKVVENVMLPLQYHTDFSESDMMERAVHLLNYVGYRGDIWLLPGSLPFYTKKAIAMARAMALDPLIMLYDRLTEGLDSYQSLQLLRFVDEFHKKEEKNRLSVIIVNDEGDIRDMKLDRVFRIENRKII